MKVRRKLIIYGYAVTVTGYLTTFTFTIIYPLSDLVFIGGCMALSGGLFISLLGICLGETDRVVDADKEGKPK